VIAADAHLHWGIVYMVRGDHPRARPFLRRSLATRPTLQAAVLLAGSWLPHGPLQAGLKRAKRLLSRGAGPGGAAGRTRS
jgi:hypothetical protein